MICYRDDAADCLAGIVVGLRRLRNKASTGRLTGVEIEAATLRMEIDATNAIRALEKMGAEVDVT